MPLQTWTKHYCPSHSVIVQRTLILVNAQSGYVEVLLCLKSVSAQPNPPFSDGKPRMKPLLIWGTGKRIALPEGVSYDRRVSVIFQPKACCYEGIMQDWIRTCWKPACEGPMYLILDVHCGKRVINHLLSVCPTNCILPGINTAVCYLI